MSIDNTSEQGNENQNGEGYVLRLFVSGSTPRSSQAIGRIKAICEEYLDGQYDLEIVDLYQQPELAQASDIIAAPTLVKEHPSPTRRLIGDLSNTEKVLNGLNIIRNQE